MDKLTSMMKKNPFQTGIIIGILACALIFSFVGLLSPQTDDLSGVNALVREDYLRMSISEYNRDRDALRAKWRTENLGTKAEETLRLMLKDPDTDPNLLVAFSSAAEKTDSLIEPGKSEKTVPAEPGSVHKSLSPFSKTLLILLGILVFLVLGFYIWSLLQNRTKRSKWAQKKKQRSETVESEDDLPKKNTPGEMIRDFEKELENIHTVPRSVAPSRVEKKEPASFAPVRQKENKVSQVPEPVEDTSSPADSEPEEPLHVPLEEPEEDPVSEVPQTFEIDFGTDSDEEEALPEDEPESYETPIVEPEEDEEIAEPVLDIPSTPEELTIVPAESADEEDDLPIAHYEVTYSIEDSYFDETFSIDENDVFLGECGIGIGETLNNDEPRTVTAFEVWLFDRNDNHTPTHYLLSDFAMANEGIVDRIKNKGNYDRIKKGIRLAFTTESLLMKITVKDLKYGTDLPQEHNSYFEKAVFDIQIRRNNRN